MTMRIVSGKQLVVLALGSAVLIGCIRTSAEQTAIEQEQTKPVLVEFERVVGEGRSAVRGINGALNQKLTAAQQVHDGGKTVKNTLGDFMVSGEAARTSTRMMQAGDSVYEAYSKAKREIGNMGRRKDISKQTVNWAQGKIEQLWSAFNKDCRSIQGR
jgi:hypothetical protein